MNMMDRKETDEELRDRLAVIIPEGGWYSAEDLGNLSGEDLDDFAESHETKRLTVTETR